MRQKRILGGKMYIWMVIFDGIRLYGLLTVFWQKFTKILPIYLLLPWALYGLSTTWLKILIPELKYKDYGAIFWKLWGDKLKNPDFWAFFGHFFAFWAHVFVVPLIRVRQKSLSRWSDDWRSHSWQWFQNSTRGFKISWKYPFVGHFSKI